MSVFGYDGAADGTQYYAADWKAGTIFTLTEQATITKISARVGNWSYSVTGKALIYNVSGGEPSGLEITCEEIVIPAGSPNNLTDWTGGDLPATLPASDYWLGVIAITAAVNWGFRSDAETGYNIKHNYDLYADGPADPFGSIATVSNKRHCIYATYTPAAAPKSSSSIVPIVEAAGLLIAPFKKRFPKLCPRQF